MLDGAVLRSRLKSGHSAVLTIGAWLGAALGMKLIGNLTQMNWSRMTPRLMLWAGSRRGERGLGKERPASTPSPLSRRDAHFQLESSAADGFAYKQRWYCEEKNAELSPLHKSSVIRGKNSVRRDIQLATKIRAK